MKNTFLDKLIGRIERVDPQSLQSFVLKLAREKGFLETISFNADSTGVAKQMIQSGAALRSAEIDAKADEPVPSLDSN